MSISVPSGVIRWARPASCADRCSRRNRYRVGHGVMVARGDRAYPAGTDERSIVGYESQRWQGPTWGEDPVEGLRRWPARGCACHGRCRCFGRDRGRVDVRAGRARQPPAGACLSTCDPVSFAPPGGIEGACTLDRWTVVAADKGHTAALKGLTLDVGRREADHDDQGSGRQPGSSPRGRVDRDEGAGQEHLGPFGAAA